MPPRLAALLALLAVLFVTADASALRARAFTSGQRDVLMAAEGAAPKPSPVELGRRSDRAWDELTSAYGLLKTQTASVKPYIQQFSGGFVPIETAALSELVEKFEEHIKDTKSKVDNVKGRVLQGDVDPETQQVLKDTKASLADMQAQLAKIKQQGDKVAAWIGKFLKLAPNSEPMRKDIASVRDNVQKHFATALATFNGFEQWLAAHKPKPKPKPKPAPPPKKKPKKPSAIGGFFHSVGRGIANAARAVGRMLFGGKPVKPIPLPPVPTHLPPKPIPPPKPGFSVKKADIEDCVACEYVWFMVEQEIGDDQIEDNVYEAFRRTCTDVQRAPIFYPACEHMFDVVYDMIVDYMNGEMSVLQICTAAGLCRDPNPPVEPDPIPPPEPPAPIPLPKPPPATDPQIIIMPPEILIPPPTPPPPPPPPPKPDDSEEKRKQEQLEKELAKFLVPVHFRNGYDMYKLFDYSTTDGRKTTANAGGFTQEQNNFPSTLNRLNQFLETIRRPDVLKRGLRIVLAGQASAVGASSLNLELSKHRAQAVACYIDTYLSVRGYSDYSLDVGYLGEERPSGMSAAAQANDRVVHVMFPQNPRSRMFVRHFLWGKGDPQMAQYCGNHRNWQNERWDDVYIAI